MGVWICGTAVLLRTIAPLLLRGNAMLLFNALDFADIDDPMLCCRTFVVLFTVCTTEYGWAQCCVSVMLLLCFCDVLLCCYGVSTWCTAVRV